MAQPAAAGTRGDVSNASVVNTQKESRSKDGAIEDLVGGLAPDTRRHGMSDVLGNSHPEAKGFSGF